MLEELNWIEEFFINKYSFITYLKKDNRKETLVTKDIFFINKIFEPTITYWSPDQNNYSLCLSNEPVSGLTHCTDVDGIWEPEQSNEPEPRCDGNGAEPEPCCYEPEPCTNEPIFEQGKCDISNLCLTATCEPDSEPEPSDLCCQEGFGNMSSYEIFMKKIGFLLLISIIILFIYNERRSIKLLFR